MNLIYSFLSLVVPLFFGVVTSISLIWHYEIYQSTLIGVFLSIGFGIGITSILYFVWSLVFSPNAQAYFIVEFTLALSLLMSSYLILRHKPFKSLERAKDYQSLWITLFIGAFFIFNLIIVLRSFYQLTLNSPNGQYDAYAIWNLRARFIFRGGENWLETFPNTIGNQHYDYPLLLPGIVARSWSLVDQATKIIPAIIAGLFTFGTAGLLFSSIFTFRTLSQALLATLILICTPAYIFWGSSQEADIPLSFYILSTCILLFLHNLFGKDQKAFIFLAGMAAFIIGLVGLARRKK